MKDIIHESDTSFYDLVWNNNPDGIMPLNNPTSLDWLRLICMGANVAALPPQNNPYGDDLEDL